MKSFNKSFTLILTVIYLAVAAICCYALIHVKSNSQLQNTLLKVAYSKCHQPSQTKTLTQCHEF